MTREMSNEIKTQASVEAIILSRKLGVNGCLESDQEVQWSSALDSGL